MFKKAFAFKENIWKVFPLDASHLVFELRDSVSRSVCWKKINIHSGAEVWTYVSTLDPWWVTIKFVHTQYLALSAFADNEMPESKGVEIIDSTSGLLKWANPNLNVVYIDHTYIVAKVEETDSYCNHDWVTGLPKESLTLKKVFSIRSHPEHPHISIHPYLFSTDNEFYSKIATYILMSTQHTATGDIEYLEVDHKVIISYYICVENGMNQYLLMSTNDGTISVHQCLGENLKGFGGESFFVQDKNVFALQSSNTLLHFQI
jgi:hypothetical protein